MVTLGRVDPVSAKSRGQGRICQWWFYGMHKQDNGQNWNKTSPQCRGKRMKLRLEKNIL